MSPPPTCYLRLSFFLHLCGFGSLVAGYCTPYWTHIKLTTGDSQALGLVVSCYKRDCEMLHVTEARTVFIIIFGLCTATLVLALFSVQAFCLALCNGSCRSRNVGACYSYLSFLVAFSLGGTLALYQIDLVQQMRPDVLSVEVGWSRWCLVGSTGGFVLGSLLNTCDSAKRNKQHRLEVQKKAEVKGKMMAEMESRRRQAAAAALRDRAAAAGRRGTETGRGFKMAAEVAARAVGGSGGRDFKGKRLSIAVDAAVTNALAQLSLQRSLASGNTASGSSNNNNSNNSNNNNNNRGNNNSNNNNNNNRGSNNHNNNSSRADARNQNSVILVNEAESSGARRRAEADMKTRRAETDGDSSRLPAAGRTQTRRAEPRDGGEDDISSSRNVSDNKNRYSQPLNASSTSRPNPRASSTTTTTSIQNPVPSTSASSSSTLPSIENLRKSKLTKAGHVDSGLDLNRHAALPVVEEEHGDQSDLTLSDKSKARLAEAQALRRKVSDTKGFAADNRTSTRAQDGDSFSKPVNPAKEEKPKSLSLSDSSSRESNTYKESANPSGKRSMGEGDKKLGTSDSIVSWNKSPSREKLHRTDPVLSGIKTQSTNSDSGEPKADDLAVPTNRGRRESAVGGALLGVSNLISETASVGGDRPTSHSNRDASDTVNRKNDQTRTGPAGKEDVPRETQSKAKDKSPSTIRKFRVSTESFSRELGIDPLPPVSSSKSSNTGKREEDTDSSRYEKRNPTEKSSARINTRESDTVDKRVREGNGHDCKGREADNRPKPTVVEKSEGSLGSGPSTQTCLQEEKRLVLPRLTSVESTSRPGAQCDRSTVPAAATTTSGQTTGEGASKVAATTAAKKDDATKMASVSSQLSEEEMKRKKIVESMVVVSREKKKKRITQ